MYKEYPTFKPEEVLEYLRKSRSDDPMLSIEEVLEKHESILSDWQEKNLNSRIPEENIYREVVSGETISSRPEFKKLLKRIESPKIKAVLIVEVQRLGRPDLEEIGKISKLFRYTETYIITPQRIFDLSDEYDREQFERELMRGNDYLEYTKKILSRGKELSLRSGYYINGTIPYGYERDWIFEGKRKRPTLKINEEKAKIVKQIFDWYVNEQIGANKISRRLNDMGIPSPNGDIWRRETVNRILKNEHYTGRIVIKKRMSIHTVEDQTFFKKRVKNDNYEIVDGKHPAIIDVETFNKAKATIRTVPPIKPNHTLKNPLASILKCECGKTMIMNKDNENYRYICPDYMYCGNSSVKYNELIYAVIKGLKQNLENIQTKLTSSDNASLKEKHKKYLSNLKSRYAECENKEIALWDKYTEEQMPKAIFEKLLQKNAEEKQRLEKELKAAENNMPETIEYNNAIATLHKAVEILDDNSVSASAKNKLLKTVIKKIVYRRSKGTQNKRTNENPFEIDIHLKF